MPNLFVCLCGFKAQQCLGQRDGLKTLSSRSLVSGNDAESIGCPIPSYRTLMMPNLLVTQSTVTEFLLMPNLMLPNLPVTTNAVQWNEQYFCVRVVPLTKRSSANFLSQLSALNLATTKSTRFSGFLTRTGMASLTLTSSLIIFQPIRKWFRRSTIFLTFHTFIKLNLESML